ncbi:MAG: hypothetical protein ACREM6_05415 [Vulcanimicrobiaceae bacterium]
MKPRKFVPPLALPAFAFWFFCSSQPGTGAYRAGEPRSGTAAGIT